MLGGDDTDWQLHFPSILNNERSLVVQELLTELADEQQMGKRGEVWFIAQVATFLLILFPPFSLEVSSETARCDKPTAKRNMHVDACVEGSCCPSTL